MHESFAPRRKWEELEMVSARRISLVFSLLACACMAAVAQPSGTPERRQAPPDSDEQRIADLVLASRILVNEGVLDSFGHVTVRSLKNPSRYFMPRAMPPALVTANDVVELDAAQPLFERDSVQHHSRAAAPPRASHGRISS
jgi:Class II Aldolase and Adducin N-terminal domain